jgi:hypothetical protein
MLSTDSAGDAEGDTFCPTIISLRVLDSIQGHSSRNVAEGYSEVTIKTQACAIAKLPRYEVAV